MAEGRGHEAEMARQMEEELEKEKQKRVEHLAQVGLRRIMQQGISRGFLAWHDQWAEKTRQTRLLQASAARLAKPKLAAAVSLWRHDWEREVVTQRTMTDKQKLQQESSLRASAETEVERLRMEVSTRRKRRCEDGARACHCQRQCLLASSALYL